MEDATGSSNERNNEEKFERIDDVIANLRGGDVETKDDGERQAEDGSAADDGIDADEEACRDAPGKLFRRGSHAKERKNWQCDAAVEPVVVDRRVAVVSGICFGGLHF